MEKVWRLSWTLQLTVVLNGAEWGRIHQFSYFSLSKFSSTAFQNTVDNCGNILMRQHLNVCLYQQHYTFFFFWSQICSWVELLSRTVPCTACSRELKGTQKLRCPYTFTGLSPGSSLIMMKSGEFFSRGSAHDKQGRLCFLIFSMMDK